MDNPFLLLNLKILKTPKIVFGKNNDSEHYCLNNLPSNSFEFNPFTRNENLMSQENWKEEVKLERNPFTKKGSFLISDEGKCNGSERNRKLSRFKKIFVRCREEKENRDDFVERIDCCALVSHQKERNDRESFKKTGDNADEIEVHKYV